MKLLYNLFIQLYTITARLIGTYNVKAKQWVKGREHIFEKLEIAFAQNHSKVIWMHCASLGEFEQGRPIIESLKQKFPKYKFLLTFFSPSGFEIHKDYPCADYIFYLPIDTKKNAKQFFDITKPSFIIYVKYEFWYYYLTEAKSRSIPLILVSAIFRNNQPFFKWYGKLHFEMLHCFTHLFVQNSESKSLLTTININKNVTVCGDTRFDRVTEITEHIYSFQEIENYIGNSKVIVAGSTWTEDDMELDHFANTHPEIKFIVAPHEINKDRLNECLSLYKHAVLYSQIELLNETINVLIIDNIGLLSKLYKYATICYIGGGFGGDGVHNVLEAAVYFKPVIFGPVYEKYLEATELIDRDGAFTVESAIELETTFNQLLTDQKFYQKTCKNAGEYVISKTGATNKIIDWIYTNRLLIN